MEDNILDEIEKGNTVYSGYLTRFGASVLDGLIIGIPMVAISMYNMFFLKNFALIALVIILASLYKPLLEYYYGATWGKMILNIKVVNARNQMISIGQAFIRSFPGIIGLFIGIYGMYALHSNEGFLYAEGFVETSEWLAENQPTGFARYRDWIATLILLISSFFIFWEPKKQAFHDKLAQTFVIKKI